MLILLFLKEMTHEISIISFSNLVKCKVIANLRYSDCMIWLTDERFVKQCMVSLKLLLMYSPLKCSPYL